MIDDYQSEALTIHAPSDNLDTERKRGTYDGRKKWQYMGKKDSMTTKSRKTPRVTDGMVSSYLGSLGVGKGDEFQLGKEADEVTNLRKEYDTLKNERIKKQNILNTMTDELNELKIQNNCKQQDEDNTINNIQILKQRTEEIKLKLDDEVYDNQVYKHMIERLQNEVNDGYSESLLKEKKLKSINMELNTNSNALLTLRQEKAASEQLYKKLICDRELISYNNERALNDLNSVMSQTQNKILTLENREKTRKYVMSKALGELNVKQSQQIKEKQRSIKSKFKKIELDILEAETKIYRYENDYRKISEAAGTSEVDEIIHKYLSRNETLKSLEKEYLDTENRMKKLKEKHHELSKQMNNVCGTGTNSRGVYLEMDETADQLKEIEKESVSMLEKYNRLNVVLDSAKSCMIKCLAKMETISGAVDLKNSSAIDIDVKTTNIKNNYHSGGSEASVVGLVHTVEQQLNNVMDTINREKAEMELHRSESRHGDLNVMSPQPTETEEHFILRMSEPDISESNLRNGPFTKRSPFEISGNTTLTAANSSNDEMVHTHTTSDDDDPVIDRQTRKKLATLVINRSKKLGKIN